MRYLKKSLSLLASALGVLVLSGFLSLRPTVLDQPALASHLSLPTACFDVSLQVGKTLTDPGSPDAGRLDFNGYSHDYQACIQSNLASDNLVKGWAWNTNLGYVSMSCKDGDNLGASCGGLDYGVVANPTDGVSGYAGRVRGFAWGDNIGWISMGCDANGLNNGVACGDFQYGVSIAKNDGEATCLNPDLNGLVDVQKDDAYGYAWSDSVGWINFCGSHFPLFGDPPVIYTTELAYENSSPTLYANGEDYYKILVLLKRDGDPAVGAQPSNVTIENLDFENSLFADQILESGDGSGGLVPTSKNDFSWNEELGGFEAYVRAVAPTDESHAKNFLKLNSVTVKNDGVNYSLQDNKYFDFSPAISVTQVTYDAAPGELGDSLFGTAVEPTNHRFLVSDHRPETEAQFNNGKFITQLHDCSKNPDEFNFSFGDGQSSTYRIDENGDPLPPLSVDPITGVGGVCSSLPLEEDTLTDIEVDASGNQGTPFTNLTSIDPDTNTSRYILAIKVYQGDAASGNATTSKAFGAIVVAEYTAVRGASTNVRYISHITTEGSLVNQAADVRGNVRIDVQKTIIEGSIQKSIGQSAQSKREPFYRAIKRLAAPVDADGPVSFATQDLNISQKNVHYYRRPKNASNTCQISLRDSVGDISPTKNITIVGEGCDIYIDKNIRFDVNSKQLGLIALEDIRSNATRRGGNVYVCKDVTDISGVHIVADGGLMSYTCDKNTIAADGLPVFASGPRASLGNQLTIFGSIISNNTYGGSVQNPPILGDGSRVGPEESYKARLFDINFLRYANTAMVGGNECWAGNLSKRLPQTCSENNPMNYSIVNIRYQSPLSDLPVFGMIGK